MLQISLHKNNKQFRIENKSNMNGTTEKVKPIGAVDLRQNTHRDIHLQKEKKKDRANMRKKKQTAKTK